MTMDTASVVQELANLLKLSATSLSNQQRNADHYASILSRIQEIKSTEWKPLLEFALNQLSNINGASSSDLNQLIFVCLQSVDEFILHGSTSLSADEIGFLCGRGFPQSLKLLCSPQLKNVPPFITTRLWVIWVHLYRRLLHWSHPVSNGTLISAVESIQSPWPEFFPSILQLVEHGSDGMEVFFRCCLVLDQELDELLKDHMRAFFIPSFSKIIYKILSERNQHLHSALRVLALFIHWIDIGFVMNNQVYPLLYAILTDETSGMQTVAIDCLIEMCSKGMAVPKKLELMSAMQLQSGVLPSLLTITHRFMSLSTDTEQHASLFDSVCRLVNTIGVQYCEAIVESSTNDQMPSIPSNIYWMLLQISADLLQLPYTSHSASEHHVGSVGSDPDQHAQRLATMADAEPWLQSQLQMYPFLLEFVHILRRPSAIQSQLLNELKTAASQEFLQHKFYPILLQIIQYPNCVIDDSDDRDEYVEYRQKWFTVLEAYVVLDETISEAAISFIMTRVKQLWQHPMGMTVAEKELSIFLFLNICDLVTSSEKARNIPRSRSLKQLYWVGPNEISATGNLILNFYQNAEVISRGNNPPVLRIAYFEAVARHIPFLVHSQTQLQFQRMHVNQAGPGFHLFLVDILRPFMDRSGLQHTDETVVKSAVYYLPKFLKPILQMWSGTSSSSMPSSPAQDAAISESSSITPDIIQILQSLITSLLPICTKRWVVLDTKNATPLDFDDPSCESENEEIINQLRLDSSMQLWECIGMIMATHPDQRERFRWFQSLMSQCLESAQCSDPNIPISELVRLRYLQIYNIAQWFHGYSLIRKSHDALFEITSPWLDLVLSWIPQLNSMGSPSAQSQAKDYILEASRYLFQRWSLLLGSQTTSYLPALLRAHIQPDFHPQKLLLVAPLLNASLHILQQQYHDSQKQIPSDLEQLWVEQILKDLLPVWTQHMFMQPVSLNMSQGQLVDLQKSFWLFTQSLFQSRLKYFDSDLGMSLLQQSYRTALQQSLSYSNPSSLDADTWQLLKVQYATIRIHCETQSTMNPLWTPFFTVDLAQLLANHFYLVSTLLRASTSHSAHSSPANRTTPSLKPDSMKLMATPSPHRPLLSLVVAEWTALLPLLMRCYGQQWLPAFANSLQQLPSSSIHEGKGVDWMGFEQHVLPSLLSGKPIRQPLKQWLEGTY